jgi:hypothetical protein
MKLVPRVGSTWATAVPLLLSAWVLLAQGGLPPDAARTAREAMGQPRLNAIQAPKGAPGPSGCYFRDASFSIVGLNFGPSAAGRRVVASVRGTPAPSVSILAWTVTRIDVKLGLGVDVEGETVTLSLVDAGGAPASVGGGPSFVVCYRDQTFLGGNVRVPSCSSERRTFHVVATGPARLEQNLTVPAHPGPVAYGFRSVAEGSWRLVIEETTPPRLFPLPPPGGALAGCETRSLGFQPTEHAVVLSKTHRRAPDQDFVELLVPRPSLELPDLSRTPTPGGFALPGPVLQPVLPATPTPTPAR